MNDFPLDEATAAASRLDKFRELRSGLPADMTLLASYGFTVAEIARRSGYSEPGVNKLLKRPTDLEKTISVAARTDKPTLVRVLSELFPGESFDVTRVAALCVNTSKKPRFSLGLPYEVNLTKPRAERLRTALREKGILVS